MKSLNTTKQSGDNSYQLKYDELKKQFDLVIKIGATKNFQTTNFQKKESSMYRFITKTITIKERLPNWQLYLMLIGVGSIVFVSIKLVLLARSTIPA